MDSARKIVRGLRPLLLVAALAACDSSPTDPLGGMNVLLEGTLVAEVDEEAEVEEGEEPPIVVEPVEHRVLLGEEGLVRVELLVWQGTDAETGETQDFPPLTAIGLNIGRVQPDGSCERGSSVNLFRDSPLVFRLSDEEYCFAVFAPPTGGPGFTAGDTASYQVSLTDTQ